MDELIGKLCFIDFDIEHTQWPLPGFPARAYVVAVDMPMVKLDSYWCGRVIWINVKFIKTICETTPHDIPKKERA